MKSKNTLVFHKKNRSLARLSIYIEKQVIAKYFFRTTIKYKILYKDAAAAASAAVSNIMPFYRSRHSTKSLLLMGQGYGTKSVLIDKVGNGL